WRPSGKNTHRYPDSKEPDDWGVRPNQGLEVPITEDELNRYRVEMRKLDWVAGKPAVVGPNPPKAPTPKGRDGKPLIDDSKPFEDRVLNRALEHLRKELGGGGQAPAPIPAPAAPPAPGGPRGFPGDPPADAPGLP